MLKTMKVTDTYDMAVYTDTGEHFGEIEEAIVTLNKIFGWRIRASRSSVISKFLGGAKGIIVPHRLVKSIGDVMIISKSAIPIYEAEKEVVEQ